MAEEKVNLQKTNKEYLEAKVKLEKASKEVESINEKLKLADIDKRKHEIARDEADIKGDEATKKAEQAEIDKVIKDIEDIKNELQEKQKDVISFEATINIKINEIKQDPSMKQTMNEALKKRYSRELNKLQKERETAKTEKLDKELEKDRYDNLKKLITEHPGLEKNLNGILAAKEEIKKLNDELATLDYKKDAKRIAEITGKDMKEAVDKLNKNKEPLMNYINKNKLNIKYEDIEKMSESGLGLDDTINGLGKEIKGYDRKIKGYGKSISDYTVSLENVEEEMKPKQTSTHTQNPGEKPKWYQFGKRFRNWMEQKEQKKLPPPPSPKKPDTIRDALKYDIVKDIYKEMQTNDLKEAKKERKEQDQR